MNAPLRRGAAVMVAAIALAACAEASVADKSGSETVVLHLATIDTVSADGQWAGPQSFIDRLAEVSGGRLQVELTEGYGAGTPDAESRLVEAIAAGEFDGGWPSSRAFANAGIAGMAAIEAPLMITSYAAEKALVDGPIAHLVLERLAGSGIAGLGLAVGPLRRPFATHGALLEPDDWRGIRFRSFNSPVQAATIAALGAEPIDAGATWVDELNAGQLDGAEFDVVGYADNDFATRELHVTGNVVLWPKVFVLSFNEQRLHALSGEQREWVTQAAALVTRASVDADFDDTTAAIEMCDARVSFADADADQLAALRAAAVPVIDALAADRDERRLLAEVEELAARYPVTDVLNVPVRCRQAAVVPVEVTFPDDEISAIPDGTYRAEVTLAEARAAGLADDYAGTWTLEITDGRYAVSCRPLTRPRNDCGNNGSPGVLEAGRLLGTGTTVYFSADPALLAELTGCELPVSAHLSEHCSPNGSYSMTWSADGDTLTFTDPSDPVAGAWVIDPWEKIA